MPQLQDKLSGASNPQTLKKIRRETVHIRIMLLWTLVVTLAALTIIVKEYIL